MVKLLIVSQKDIGSNPVECYFIYIYKERRIKVVHWIHAPKAGGSIPLVLIINYLIYSLMVKTYRS